MCVGGGSHCCCRTTIECTCKVDDTGGKNNLLKWTAAEARVVESIYIYMHHIYF